MQVLLLISSFQSQVSVCQPGLSSVVCHRVCMLRFIHSFKTSVCCSSGGFSTCLASFHS